MKLIVAGSRDITSYDLVLDAFSKFAKTDVTTIISGGARGVDRLGERLAKEKGFALEVRYADWELHGKRAGYIRNAEMADEGDYLLALWDLKSPGTKHMIRLALDKGLYVEVYSLTGICIYRGTKTVFVYNINGVG